MTAWLAVSMALVASGSPVVAATKGAGIGSVAAKAGPNCDAQTASVKIEYFAAPRA